MRFPFRILFLAALSFPLACQGVAETESDDTVQTRAEPLEGARGCEDPRTQIVLPGPRVYPEGVTVTPDGTFYAGSMGTGAIVRVRPGASVAEPFVSPRNNFGVYGLVVDARKHTLWACTVDDGLLPAQSTYLHGYNLSTGALEQSYALPGVDGFCNDLTLDRRGNLYATDSLAQTVVTLPAGGHQVVTWASGPLFGGDPGRVTANGIVLDKSRNRLLVGNMFKNTIIAVPLRGDGRPGEATVLEIEPPVVAPDGIEFVDDDTLVIPSFSAGTVTLVRLTDHGRRGVSRIIASGLAQPATAAVYRGSAWVAVSQGFELGEGERPDLPFIIKRIPLPAFE
ncbi:hypothetical protein LVJ94_03255 [Pendulispora rubella]|uniref:SMP-30/Gluconolactonase/LRE-like region domain-containing protein n=1 Tax=Pendulispora rubella TaxID=2741070 RepID=A0ABZ2L5P9_9BACT